MSTVIGVDLARGTLGTITMMAVSSTEVSQAFAALGRAGIIGAGGTTSYDSINLPPKGQVGYVSWTGTILTPGASRDSVRQATQSYGVAVLLQRGTGGAEPDDILDLAQAYDPVYQATERAGNQLAQTARAVGNKIEGAFDRAIPELATAVDRYVKIGIIGGLIVLLLLGLFFIWTKI